MLRETYGNLKEGGHIHARKIFFPLLTYLIVTFFRIEGGEPGSSWSSSVPR